MSLGKSFSVFVLFVFIHIGLVSQNLSIDSVTNTMSFQDSINQFWIKYKPYVENLVKSSDKNTYNLYNVQINTNVLLEYAFKQKKYDLVDDMLDVYLGALNTIDSLDRYKFAHFFPLEQPVDTTMFFDQTYYVWLDRNDSINLSKENILAISQFLALVSDAIFNIASISVENRTEKMIYFANLYSDVLDSHYHRWIFGANVFDEISGEEFKNVGPFQLQGWNCRYDNKPIPTRLTHKQLIDLLLDYKCGNNDSKVYCNSITDSDLWIIAGLSSFAAAYIIDSSLVGKVSNFDFYKNEYLPTANELILSRISTTIATNFEDSLVWGADFDNGILDDYPDNKFSGYLNPDVYPTENDVAKSANIGWDISHARRFVNVFQTLYDTKDILGFDFPTTDIMAMFANQYAYNVFNRDFEFPLFSNYFDGANGWYRVGYANRVNFGYGPSDLSITSLTGGFPFWSVYNYDVRIISNSLYELIHTNDSTKQSFLNKHYEEIQWTNDLSSNLPIRKQSHVFEKGLGLEPDYASLAVLLSFYPAIAISDTVLNVETKVNDTIQISINTENNLLSILSEKKIKEVVIIDTKKQLIFSKRYRNSFVLINIKDLSKGIYIIRIKTENNDIIRKKIVII